MGIMDFRHIIRQVHATSIIQTHYKLYNPRNMLIQTFSRKPRSSGRSGRRQSKRRRRRKKQGHIDIDRVLFLIQVSPILNLDTKFPLEIPEMWMKQDTMPP